MTIIPGKIYKEFQIYFGIDKLSAINNCRTYSGICQQQQLPDLFRHLLAICNNFVNDRNIYKSVWMTVSDIGFHSIALWFLLPIAGRPRNKSGDKELSLLFFQKRFWDLWQTSPLGNIVVPFGDILCYAYSMLNAFDCFVQFGIFILQILY